MLLQVRNELAKRGVAIAVVASDDAIRDGLRRYGFGIEDGSQEFFPTVDSAIERAVLTRVCSRDRRGEESGLN